MAHDETKNNEKEAQDLTAEEVARPLNVSPRSVRMWADEGKIPEGLFYRLPGGHWRFKPEIIEHLRNHKAA